MISPQSIGFVHLWDINIHEYDVGVNDLNKRPDKAWLPTTLLMKRYAKHYNSYFAINTIGALVELNLFAKKTDFLKDVQHPNEAGFNAITDFVFYALLKLWKTGLAKEAFSKLKFNTRIEALPVFSSRNNADDVLPKAGVISHCLMSFPPQFSDVSAIKIVSTNLSFVQLGKADVHRQDRKKYFELEPCSARNNSGGIYFRVSIPKPQVIYLATITIFFKS